MNDTLSGNIPICILANLGLPSPDEFVLFFDASNSNHLTGLKNIGGVRITFDYENTTSTGVKYKGIIDASTNPACFPSGDAGDLWLISNSGTIQGISVNSNDAIIANVTTVGCLIPDWDLVGGASTCIVNDTYANILALKTAGTLALCTRYRITDPLNNAIGIPLSLFYHTYTILLTANTNDSFNEASILEAVYVNDSNRRENDSINFTFTGFNVQSNILTRRDSRNNVVTNTNYGNGYANDIFQWGNDKVTNNIINGGNIVMYDYIGVTENLGSCIGNTLGVLATIFMQNNTNAISFISNNFIGAGSIIHAESQTGFIQNNTIGNLTIITANFNSGNINFNIIGNSVTLNTGNLLANRNTLNILNNEILDTSNLTLTTNTGTIQFNLIFGTLNMPTNSGLFEYNHLNKSTVRATTNTGQIIGNILYGTTITADNNDGLLKNNFIDICNLFFDANVATIQNNIFKNCLNGAATQNFGTIENNTIKNSDTFNISTNYGTIKSNTIENSHDIDFFGNLAFINNNFFNVAHFTSIQNNDGDLNAVSFNHIENVRLSLNDCMGQFMSNYIRGGIVTDNPLSLIVEINLEESVNHFNYNRLEDFTGSITFPTYNLSLQAPTNKILQNGLSTFETVKSIVANDITLNSSYDVYCGVINVNGTGTLNTITGTGKIIPYELRGLSGTVVTVNFTAVALPIATNQIAGESASIVLTGRSTNSDFLTVRKDNASTWQRQINASVLI